MSEQRDSQIESLKALQKGLNSLEEQRVAMIAARRKVMYELHHVHNVSLRDIGAICTMSAPAVLGNLNKHEAELAEQQLGN